MSGLFGYFDPESVLPQGTERRMARALRLDLASRAAFAYENGACIGVVDRNVFPGSGRVLRYANGCRTVCFQGEIVAFSGEAEPLDRMTAIERCFCGRLDLDLLSRAVGSFVAAIVDERTNMLEIVTDRNGTFPIYFARVGDVFLFAGQQKALLATGYVRPEVDPLATSLLLRTGYVGGQRTLLKNIQLAPPGAVLRIGVGRFTSNRYWTQEFRSDRHCDWDREVDRVGGLISRAVRRVFRPGARIGVPLSGGLDSRTLLALSPDCARVPSFTFGTEGCRDLRFGADTARALGSPHHSLSTGGGHLKQNLQLGVWLTEGLLGASHFHILPHVPEFARWSDIVLNGIGGDVILGGKYVREPWLGTTDLDLAANGIWSWLAAQLPGQFEALLRSPLVPVDAHAEAKRLFTERYKESPGLTPMDKAMAFLLEDRTRRFIGCGTELLRWRVESHHPFFDNDFLSAVARLPHAWRRRQRFYIAVLKRAAPAAARIRWQHTGLPASVPYPLSWLSMAFHRGADAVVARIGMPTLFPHRAMSCFADWFRGPLRELLDGIVLSARALDRGLVSADLARKAVNDHLQGRGDHSSLLGVLLSLELFCRYFVDDIQSAIDQYSGSRKLPFDHQQMEDQRAGA